MAVRQFLRNAGSFEEMDSNIQLASTEIHVWLTFPDAITDERLLSAYRGLLNAMEQREELRFYWPRDRHRYLVSRALLRTVLSRYASIGPKDWSFSTSAYGRPEIANTHATDGGLSFSVSHTQGLIALAVANNRTLGIDVEHLAASDASITLAHHFFSSDEVAAVHDVPHQQQQLRFFEYWTLKEAYVKARGMGFSIPLESFSIRFPDDHSVNLVSNAKLDDDSSRWQLWQFRPASEHLVAVCAERLNAQSPKLTVRETIPTVSERIMTPKLLRTSATAQASLA